jgi:hypothetical protein
MTPEEFLLKVVRLYQDARISRYIDAKIRRGRSHSISSIAEDLFASYLLSADKTIDFILVDQPVHVPDTKTTFYPDITIVRNSQITAFLDLKMDLGWKRRGLVDLCRKDQALMQAIRGSECIFKDGETKERKSYPISDSAVYDIVVVSGENIAQKLLDDQLAEAGQYAEDVMIHILTTNEHPNTYGYTPEALMEKIRIEHDAFVRISERVK